jgi:glycosyltransferase involved in cell wall biosynthesis
LNVPASKIRVIYPSGHEGFSPLKDSEKLGETKQRLGVKDKYFLTVGTVEPRKNVHRVIEAFIKFTRENSVYSDYQLVVVGLTDFAHGSFVKPLLQKFSSDANILLAGYVEREDLNCLYSGAVGFLFPSLYEGFGIPVLEAMASGVPVLTSRTTSLPEVAGEAAYYVDPADVEDIAKGMKIFAGDPSLRNGLIEKGFQRIKRFSWRETAHQTMEVYEKLKHG